MSAKTSIEWTATVNPDGTVTPGRTWNPTRGCSRVSLGCGGPKKVGGCYAEKVAYRFSGPGLPYEGLARMTANGPRWTGVVRLIPEALDEPLHWRKPQKVFVNSMSDLFHEALPDSAIDHVFAVMALAPRHTFQILTKRPARMLAYMAKGVANRIERAALARNVWTPADVDRIRAMPLPNVWLGTSVEDQATADERIPLLLQTPAAVRFVSYEPALEGVDFSRFLPGNCSSCGETHYDDGGCAQCEWMTESPGIDWIITGAESGPGARHFDPDWARSVRDQCQAAGVAFFFKQDALRGKKIPTPELDGRRWVEFPGEARP